ncbi:unnamed protein product [Musa acuminata subsp. burmannicoides]
MLKEVQICECNNLHMPHRTQFSRQGVEFEDCGQQGRVLVQEHSHIAGSCGERIPLSYSPASELSALYITLISCSRGQVSESWRAGRRPSRSRRCTSWKPTEGPVPCNRLRGHGRGLHAGGRERSGTGESAPGQELGADGGALGELLGGSPSSDVAMRGHIYRSNGLWYLSLAKVIQKKSQRFYREHFFFLVSLIYLGATRTSMSLLFKSVSYSIA